jgi:hypothetical protein
VTQDTLDTFQQLKVASTARITCFGTATSNPPS